MKKLDAMNILPSDEDGYVQVELIYKLEDKEYATESEVVKCNRPTLAGLSTYMQGEGMDMFMGKDN